jgi:predicted DNA-binding protein (MmcQ/YjbR family)
MTFESIRAFCLSLPHATEDVQWESELLFRVGGKIFAMLPLELGDTMGRLAFKCSAERCAELLEMEGVERAPYLGRYDWVILERLDVMRDSELRDLLRESYDLVWAKLPKRTREKLTGKSISKRKVS